MGQSPTPEELAEAATWYQGVTFPDGTRVGEWGTEKKYRAMVEGHDLEGQHVADIGCMAGVGCKALEELGAHVTGIDPSPASARQFPLVKRAFDLRAKHFPLDILAPNHYEVLPHWRQSSGERAFQYCPPGWYNHVVMAGVYYHTPHPLLAIDRAWGMTQWTLFLEGEVWVPKGPAAKAEEELKGEWGLCKVRNHGPDRHPGPNYCVPTVATLMGWVHSLPMVGKVELVHPFKGQPRRALVRVTRGDTVPEAAPSGR